MRGLENVSDATSTGDARTLVSKLVGVVAGARHGKTRGGEELLDGVHDRDLSKGVYKISILKS